MTVKKMPLLTGILGLLLSSSAWAMPTSVTQLCANDKCINANQVVTPVALYHRLGELFTKNTGRKITFCDADPSIHLCFQQMLKMSASSSVMTADVKIDAADMLEVKMSQDETSLTALLDMSVEANGTYPDCATAQAQVVVDKSDKVSVMIDNFGCAFTSTSTSDLNMGFDIDYIDFEKAILGGYYTFSASQAMHGMKSGYALLRFAEPVSGEFEGVIPVETKVVPAMEERNVVSDIMIPEKEGAPCAAEKNRDDDMVQAAIEAATRAEAEAKVAVERAVKRAEEAAQATNKYAQKKAEEALKAKKAAEKAMEMAKAARSRVDNQVTTMSYDGEKKTTAKTKTEQTPVVLNEIVESQSAAAKTGTAQKTIVKHVDVFGNVSKQVIDEPVVIETVNEPQGEVLEIVIESPSVPQTEETFFSKRKHWVNKADYLFRLDNLLS